MHDWKPMLTKICSETTWFNTLRDDFYTKKVVDQEVQVVVLGC